MDSRESIIRQSKFQRVLQYIEKFGFFTAMRLVLSLKMGKGQTTFKYGKNVLYIRKGTSDVQAFEQIFLLDDYDINIQNLSPRLIVDAGANVGYASLYFANKYPEATIVAVEPESQNYKWLCQNTAGYPNIKAVKSAVWNEDTFLRVVDQGLGSWGFTVESCGPNDSGAFKATSIGTLLSDTGKTSIDILKMDIEGAEKEVFTTNYQQWLPNVSVMIVELHDRIKAGTSDVFYKAIEGQNFTIQEKGENLILSKIR